MFDLKTDDWQLEFKKIVFHDSSKRFHTLVRCAMLKLKPSLSRSFVRVSRNTPQKQPFELCTSNSDNRFCIKHGYSSTFHIGSIICAVCYHFITKHPFLIGSCNATEHCFQRVTGKKDENVVTYLVWRFIQEQTRHQSFKWIIVKNPPKKYGEFFNLFQLSLSSLNTC